MLLLPSDLFHCSTSGTAHNINKKSFQPGAIRMIKEIPLANSLKVEKPFPSSNCELIRMCGLRLHNVDTEQICKVDPPREINPVHAQETMLKSIIVERSTGLHLDFHPLWL